MRPPMPALAVDRRFDLKLRRGDRADIEPLLALEAGVFTTDRLSRASFRRLLGSRSAALMVAEQSGIFAGYALVLFRARCSTARLYSIAVAPDFARHGVGAALLVASERMARERGCAVMRLEVQDHNAGAIRMYERSGYRAKGRARAYYVDGGDALRYEKRLP
jgi:ribosomal protein S18 acetylase RimI-like enzyme